MVKETESKETKTTIPASNDASRVQRDIYELREGMSDFENRISFLENSLSYSKMPLAQRDKVEISEHHPHIHTYTKQEASRWFLRLEELERKIDILIGKHLKEYHASKKDKYYIK